MSAHKTDAAPASPPSFSVKHTPNPLDVLASLGPGLRPPAVLRSSSVGPSATAMPLIRATSANRTTAQAGHTPGGTASGSGSSGGGGAHTLASASEWRAFVAIEERSDVRARVHDAYRRTAPSYTELLELVCAIDEELLFASAPTRLEYFKSAIDWDNRLLIKRKQLSGSGATGAGVGPLALTANSGAAAAAAAANALKRKPNGQPFTPVAEEPSAASSAAVATAAAPAASSNAATAAAGTANNATASPVATTPGGHPLSKKLRVATE